MDIVIAALVGGFAGIVTAWITTWSILGPAKMREVELLENECRARGIPIPGKSK